MGKLTGFIESTMNGRAETEYYRRLEGSLPSFDAWIRKREENLPVCDMSLPDDALDSKGQAEYSARFEGISFRIIPMDICEPGLNTSSYLEDIIIFCNGELTDTALPLLAAHFKNKPECGIVYGDEDISERDKADIKYEGVYYAERSKPNFKPVWSPHTFLSHFYFCNIVAVRRTIIRDLIWTGNEKGAACLYHNLLRVIFANEYNLHNIVGNISEILVHARNYSNSLIEDDYGSSGMQRFEGGEGNPEISVVIFTKNNLPGLISCLKAVRHALDEADLTGDIRVIDNASPESSRVRTVDAQIVYNFSYDHLPEERSEARLKNMAAEAANGRVLLMLDDRVELKGGLDLKLMYRNAILKFSGVVGTKMIDRDGNIVNAGLINTRLGMMRKLFGLSDSSEYAEGFNRYTQDILAVSMECCMFRTDLYRKIGAFDESLPAFLSELDFCLRLYESGYHNCTCNKFAAVYTGYASSKLMPLQGGLPAPFEWQRFVGRHPALRKRDPYCGSGMLRDNSDVRLLPASEFSYETASETPEKILRTLSVKTEEADFETVIEFAGRLGNFLGNDDESSYIQGWIVDPNKNNARYVKYIALRSDRDTFYIPFAGCYRSDLPLTYKEAANTELSGFAIRFERSDLPPATYQIGGVLKPSFGTVAYVNYTDVYLVVNK